MKKRVGKKKKSICTMEELKEGAMEELFYSSMFKADPRGLLFLCSHSPSTPHLTCALFPSPSL